MRPKAPPGKRYCKQCPQLLPIHLRVCSHCHAPQYTREQLDREDRKGKRDQDESSEDEEVLREVRPSQRYEDVLREPNPFASHLPISIAPCLEGSAPSQSLTVHIGETSAALEAGETWVGPELALMNPAGRVRALAWALHTTPPYFLAAAVQKDLQELEYGRIYEGQGTIQIWRFDELTPSLAFSFAHQGKAVYDVKWLPSYGSHDFLGTLLYTASNGLIAVCNIPMLLSGTYWLEPLETFQVPGLVFQSLAWLHPANRFAAGSQDGSILVFQSGCSQPVVSIWGAHALPVTALALSYKYNHLSSCSLDGLLKLWDPCEGSLKDTVCSNKVLSRQRWNYHIAWHPQGDFLFFDNDGVTSPHKVIKVSGERCLEKKHVSDVSREATLCTVYSTHSGYAYIAASDGRISAVYLKVSSR